MAKKPVNFRLTEDCQQQLEYVAKKLLTDKTGALHISVDEKAKALAWEQVKEGGE